MNRAALLAVFFFAAARSLLFEVRAQTAVETVPISVMREARVQSSCDSIRPSAATKLLYLAGASLVYAGVDYVGFNITRRNDTRLAIYRVFQVLMQGAITWFLYDRLGLPTAIGFNVIWWTFGLDFLYYGYAELINPGQPWESRGDLQHKVFDHEANWAYWTPVGIARGMKRSEGIPGDTLLAQSLIGAALGITITITF